MSRPSRDAWIETLTEKQRQKIEGSRPSRDAWIETLPNLTLLLETSSRVPRGTRGLKLLHP